MSVDREYAVKVNITANTAGAKDATESLKEVGKASTDAGEAGKKSAEGMFDSHTELRHLLHGIGDDAVPGMGHAFSMLAMGPLGAVVALTSVVEFLKRGIEETNQKLDQMSANAAKAFGGGDWITDYINALIQATTQTDNLAEALRKASDAGPEIKNRYDAEAKAITAVVDALKAKLKAQEESDLAEARKNGATPEEMEAMRARYESQSQAAQDAADQALDRSRKRELAERERNQGDLTAAAKQKETPVDVIQRRNTTQDLLKAQEAALAQATADMHTSANDDLKEKAESNKALLEDSRKRYGDSDPLGLVKQMQDETDKLESETAEARAEAAKAKIAELGKQVIADQHNADMEKSALEDATKAATDNATRVVELQKQITDAERAATAKAESISQLLNQLTSGSDAKTFEKVAGVDTAGGMTDFIDRFTAARQRLQNHQGTQADQQTIMLMNRLLAATRESDQAVNAGLVQVLNDLANHKEQTKRDMQALLRTIESKGK